MTVIDTRVPNFEVYLGADRITPHVNGLNLLYPMSDPYQEITLDGEIELVTPVDGTLPMSYFDNELYPQRWGEGNLPIGIYLNDDLFCTARIAENGYSWSWDTRIARVKITDLLKVIQSYIPPQDAPYLTVGANNYWFDVAANIMRYAGEVVGLSLSVVTPDPRGKYDVFNTPRRIRDNAVKESQKIIGERGQYWYCDKNEVIRPIAYPIDGGTPLARFARGQLVEYKSNTSLDRVTSRLTCISSAEQLDVCANRYPKVARFYDEYFVFGRGYVGKPTKEWVLKRRITRDKIYTDPLPDVLGNIPKTGGETVITFTTLTEGLFKDIVALKPPYDKKIQGVGSPYTTPQIIDLLNALQRAWITQSKITEVRIYDAQARLIRAKKQVIACRGSVDFVIRNFPAAYWITPYEVSLEDTYNGIGEFPSVLPVTNPRTFVTTYTYGRLTKIQYAKQVTAFYNHLSLIVGGTKYYDPLQVKAIAETTTKTYEEKCLRKLFDVTIEQQLLGEPTDTNPLPLANPTLDFDEQEGLPDFEYKEAEYPTTQIPHKGTVDFGYPTFTPFVRSEAPPINAETLTSDEGCRDFASYMGRRKFQRHYSRIITMGYSPLWSDNTPFRIINAGKGSYIVDNLSFTIADSSGGKVALVSCVGNLIGFIPEIPEPVIPPPQVITETLSIGPIADLTIYKDAPYTLILQAVGGTKPYTFSATGLPSGMTITSGKLVGTPTVAGVYSVTVTVTDAVLATSDTSFTLTVEVAPAPIRPIAITVTLTSDIEAISTAELVTALPDPPPSEITSLDTNPFLMLSDIESL